MNSTVLTDDNCKTDAWAWWETRRLRYNLALAAAGWAAYGLNAAIFYGFHHPIWTNWRGGLSMTLFLGTGFLVVMGVANVCFLLGALVESMVAPAERQAYRTKAYRLGFWGSVALPFVFPLLNFCMLLADG
jgi:hypothetical protein